MPTNQTINVACLPDGMFQLAENFPKAAPPTEREPNAATKRKPDRAMQAIMALRTSGRLVLQRLIDQPPAFAQFMQRALQPPDIVAREARCRRRRRRSGRG